MIIIVMVITNYIHYNTYNNTAGAGAEGAKEAEGMAADDGLALRAMTACGRPGALEPAARDIVSQRI
eukprot:14639053-Heterocapsa_arctica.AAC.1